VLSGAGMKRLMPLLALSVTACGPETLNRDLREIPGLRLVVSVGDPTGNLDSPYAKQEFVELWYDRAPNSDAPCYRIPASSRLTVNGATIPLQVRGEPSLSFDGVTGCARPWFAGAERPMGEARVEYLLTDRHSRMRAVFQELHVARRVYRVNGQEQATLRGGETVDIEWLPATDQLDPDVGVQLREEGSSGDAEVIRTVQVEGNHIRFTLPPLKAGPYKLSVFGSGNVGVDACEGFSSCEASFSKASTVSVLVE
jgi:hypothetical protein